MASSVEEYLAAVPKEARAALDKVRKAIKAAAPGGTEGISYGIPTYKLEGRPLVGFGASRNHCGFYVMSPEVMEAHREELEAYNTSKGTIRFPATKPLPAALVRKLVRARVAENASRSER
jgi:uncharacterized protein YdhG (YjbR/CyaY superfamily)